MDLGAVSGRSYTMFYEILSETAAVGACQELQKFVESSVDSHDADSPLLETPTSEVGSAHLATFGAIVLGRGQD